MPKCDSCGKCCNHVTIELDTPRSKADFEEIKWFVIHKDVSVFVDDDKVWHIQFNTPCNALKDNMCDIYDKRPEVCREYDPDECENNGIGKYYKIMFTKPSQVESFVKKRFARKSKR